MAKMCAHGAPTEGGRMKINKSTIERLLPRSDAYFVWDDSLRGFGVRIAPSGAKQYWVRFRVGRGRGAKQRKRSIGTHGSPWTPDQARAEALSILSMAAQGVDQVREGGRPTDTINALCDRFLDEHVATKRKASTQLNYTAIIDDHIRPLLGQKQVKDNDFHNVSRLHAAMAEKPYQANRTLAVLSKMFALAERWGHRKPGSNPCRGVDRFKEKRRERFLSSEEISRLLGVIAELERERGHWPPLGMLKLLLLTEARRGEIEKLKWSEVDFERGAAFKEDSKTGQRSIPLNGPALDVLACLPRVEGSIWVFPARSGSLNFQGLPKAWREIRRCAGLEDVRIHDLRHTFASLSVAAGVSLPILGKALGHTSPQTTQRYAHLSDNPVRDAVERTGAIIIGGDGREL